MKTFLIINSISGTKINIQLIIETPKFHSCKEYVNKYNAQVGYEISPSTAGQNTSNFFDIAGSISTSKNNNLKWHRDLPSKRWFCVRFCLLFAVTFLKPLNIITKKYFVALNWFPCNYIFFWKNACISIYRKCEPSVKNWICDLFELTQDTQSWHREQSWSRHIIDNCNLSHISLGIFYKLSHLPTPYLSLFTPTQIIMSTI